MAKTTTVQRQRRGRALASRLYDPWVEGKFSDYRGNPAHAPKRWKRLWARQWRYVANARKAQRAQAQKEQSK